MTDDWFRITKASIRFYEQMFDTPYPFDKIDSVMCPDYAMGAMENVGCITYNDDYIPRDENFTRYKQENIAMIVGSSCKYYCFSCNREYFVRNAEYPCFYNRISLLLPCSTLFGVAV